PPAVPELREAMQQNDQRSLTGLHVMQSLVADLGVALTKLAACEVLGCAHYRLPGVVSGMTLRSQPPHHPRGTPWVPAQGTSRWFPPGPSTDSARPCAGEPAVLGQRRVELPARGDAELREHVAQVPFDRARADEQLRADLRVRKALAGEPGDLLLLRRQLPARPGAALPRLLARRQQLAAGALGERLHADRVEQVVGGAQLPARVDSP